MSTQEKYQSSIFQIIRKNNKRKCPRKCFLGSGLTIMALSNQRERFDDLPSCMCIPFADSAEELWKWDGSSEREYMFICDEARTYVLFGATTPRAEVIASDDPRVAKSFEVFGEVMSIAIAMLIKGDAEICPKRPRKRTTYKPFGSTSKKQGTSIRPF